MDLSELLRQSGYTGEQPCFAEHLSETTPDVRRRVRALKKIQVDTVKVEADFYERVHQLEKEFQSRFDALNQKRAAIVKGEVEPTEAECDIPLLSTVEPEELKKLEDEWDEKNAEIYEDGIPKFWLNALRGAAGISEMIQEQDVPLLKSLTDVTCSIGDNPQSFTLRFYFAPNDYFTNTVLEKYYEISTGVDEKNPFEYEGPVVIMYKGCEINWKDGKNITKKVIKKKQKKGLSAGKFVTKHIKTDSFFNFFEAVETRANPSGDVDDEELRDLMRADFELGQLFRDQVIHRAVLYFTGEAVEDEHFDDFDEEDMDDLIMSIYGLSVRCRRLVQNWDSDVTIFVGPLGELLKNEEFVRNESRERWTLLLTCERILMRFMEQCVLQREAPWEIDNNFIVQVVSTFGCPDKMKFGYPDMKMGFTGALKCSHHEALHWSNISSSVSFSVYIMAMALRLYLDYDFEFYDAAAEELSTWSDLFRDSAVLVDALRESDDRLYYTTIALDNIRAHPIALPLCLRPERIFVADFIAQGLHPSVVLDAVNSVSGTSYIYRMFRRLAATHRYEVAQCLVDCFKDHHQMIPRTHFTTRRIVDTARGPAYMISTHKYGAEKVEMICYKYGHHEEVREDYVNLARFFSTIDLVLSEHGEEIPRSLQTVIASVFDLKNVVRTATGDLLNRRR